MTRCKLEYLIKGIDIKDRKRLIFLIDVDNYSDFHRVNTKAIEDFKNVEYDLSDVIELIMFPQNLYVAALTSRNQTVNVHGNRAFKEVFMVYKDHIGRPIYLEFL